MPERLTREMILQETGNGYAVFARHLSGLYPGGKIEPGRNISNPFLSERQSTPSFNIYRAGEVWRYKDFARSEDEGDCFDYTARCYGLDVRSDFPEVLRRIAEECGLIPSLSTPAPATPDFTLTPRPFTPADVEFWGRVGVTVETLNRFGVRSVASFTAPKRNGSTYTVRAAPGEIIVAYPYAHDGTAWKVYRPNAERRFLFLGTKPPDSAWGLGHVPERCDTLALCAGEKDTLAAVERGFAAVTLNSETATLTPSMLAALRARARVIVSVYDLDTTGRESAARLRDRYGISTVTLPEWVKERGGKDLSDFFTLGGTVEEFRALVESVTAVTGVTPVTGVTGVTGTFTFSSITAADLARATFTEPEWIVPELLPVGMAILGGRPKGGKSWWSFNLALAVANGGRFMGELPTVRSEVAYLALEDNRRRLQTRLAMLQQAEQVAPSDGLHSLHFLTEFPRFDNGGFDALETLLVTNPNIRLVIIDTLQKVRGRQRGGKDSYAGDYDEMGRLQTLALRHSAAILVVHHTTKATYSDPFDAISGTTAIAGAADTLFVLARDPAVGGAVLHLRGRDVEERAMAVRWDKTTGVWSLQGEAAQVRVSEERRRVLAVFVPGEVLGPKEVAERSGAEAGAVRQLLPRMVRAGELTQAGYGKYQLPVTPVTVVTPVTPVTDDREPETLPLFGEESTPETPTNRVKVTL